MANYKTPGVYVEEISTLPPSVGQVPTAVPAFIGYSEKAIRNGKSIINVPTHITSLLDYHIMFGYAADFGKINVSLNADSSVGTIDFEKRFYLYDSVRMFFANGGGQCYIVAVGTYSDDVIMDKLLGGLSALEKEDHPTILLCADAMLLKKKDQAYTIQQAMLMQCNKLQDRVAVLDVFNGFIDRSNEDVILDFRNGIGVNNLKYGATYYPWIQTTLSNNFGFEHINLKDKDGKDINIEDLVDDPSAIKNLKQAIADLKTISNFVLDPLANNKSLNDTFFKIEEKIRGKKEELVYYANIIKSLIKSIFDLKTKGLSNILIDNELSQKLTYSSAIASVARALTAISNDADLKVIDPKKDFLEFDLVYVIEAGYNLIGSLILLFFYESSVVLMCLAVLIPVVLISRVYGKRMQNLTKKKNDELENQVDIITNADHKTLTRHYNKLRTLQIKMSDQEAFNFGFMELMVMIVLGVSLLLTYQTSGTAILAGNIVGIFLYVTNFAKGLETIPYTIQRLTSLTDITRRIELQQDDFGEDTNQPLSIKISTKKKTWARLQG